jgi:hypothetical protein
MYLPKPIHASTRASPYLLIACPEKLSHTGHFSLDFVIAVDKSPSARI